MKKDNLKLIFALSILFIVTGIGLTLRYLEIPIRGVDSLINFYAFLLAFFAKLLGYINNWLF